MTKDSVQRVAAAIFSRLKGAFAPLDHNHPDATAADAGFMSSDDKKALSELYQPISSMAEADLGNYTYFGDWFYGNSTALVGTILRNCPGIYYETDVLPFRQDAIFLGEADDAAFQECFWLAIPHGDYDLLDGDYSHYGIYYARKGDTVPEFYMDADHGEFAQVSLQERFAAAMAGNTVRHSHWHDASDIASGTIPIDRLPVGTSDKNVAAGNHSHSQYASSTHSHPASSITSGTLAIARIPTGTTSSTVALGNHTHSQYAASAHGHAASAITTGSFAAARIPQLDISKITDLQTTLDGKAPIGAYTARTSLASLPSDKPLIIANLSANASNLSLASVPPAGREVHIIIKNTGTAAITVTIPTASPYINTTDDASITIDAGKYGEISIISDGTNLLVRAVGS